MTITKKPLNEFALAWVKALESGKYRQWRGALTQIKGKRMKHCCLGVACLLYSKQIEKLVVTTAADKRQYDGEEAILPPKVAEALGLNHADSEFTNGKVKCQLSELNDNGHSFKEIAELIRSQPPGLFK